MRITKLQFPILVGFLCLSLVQIAQAQGSTKDPLVTSRLATLHASAQYKIDMRRLASLADLFSNAASRLKLAHGMYRFEDSSATADFLQELRVRDALGAEFHALKTKYSPFMHVNDANEMPALIRHTDSHYETMSNSVIAFRESYSFALKTAADDLNKALDNIVRRKNGHVFNDPTHSIYELITRIETLPEVYAALSGSPDDQVQAYADNSLERFEQLKRKDNRQAG